MRAESRAQQIKPVYAPLALALQIVRKFDFGGRNVRDALRRFTGPGGAAWLTRRVARSKCGTANGERLEWYLGNNHLHLLTLDISSTETRKKNFPTPLRSWACVAVLAIPNFDILFTLYPFIIPVYLFRHSIRTGGGTERTCFVF